MVELATARKKEKNGKGFKEKVRMMTNYICFFTTSTHDIRERSAHSMKTPSSREEETKEEEMRKEQRRTWRTSFATIPSTSSPSARSTPTSIV